MDENNRLRISKPKRSKMVSKKKNSAICIVRKNKKNQIDFEWELPKIDEVIYILKKQKKERTHQDIKILDDYLTSNLKYFKQLKEKTDPYQYEKILYVLKYEEVKEGKNIVTYDEEGDKCYIVLKGAISILKPIYFNEQLTMRQYIIYLNELDKKDPSTISRKRIMAKNNHIEVDVLSLLKTNFSIINNVDKYNIFKENFEKVFEAKEGFSFGESALLHKQKRNATVRADKFCKLIYIDKLDYNRILKEIEKNRIDEEIKKFVKKYNFFSRWGYVNIHKLYSLMTNVELFKDEFIYRQNEDSDYIYFCIDGSYEIYSLISFGWKKEFIKYITNPNSNLFFKIDPNKRYNDLKLLRLIKEAKESIPESPMILSEFDSGKCNIGLIELNDINELIIKRDKKFSDPVDLFKVNMSNLDSSGILGLEEAVEFKKRFTSIKVKSKNAILKKVKSLDFFKVLLSNQKDERDDELMLNYICEKKKSLVAQILLCFNYKKNMQMNRYIEEYKKCYNGCNYNKTLHKKMISYINTLSTNPTDINKTKNIFSNKKYEIKNPININSYYDLSNTKKKSTIETIKSKRNSKKSYSIKLRPFSSNNEHVNIRNGKNNYSNTENKIESQISKYSSFSPFFKSQKSIIFKEENKNFGNNNETTMSSSNFSNLKNNKSNKTLINFKKNFVTSSQDKSNIKSRHNKNKLFINTDKIPSFNLKNYKKNLYFKSGFFVNEIIKLGLGPNIPLRKETMILKNDDSIKDNNIYNIESNYSNNRAFSLENNARKRRNYFLKITKV